MIFTQLDVLLAEGRVDELRQQYVDTKKVPPHVFEELIAIDPTENKKYLPWMVKRMSEERSHVNLTRLKELVPFFEKMVAKNKLQGAEKDIFQYKTIEALYDKLKHFMEDDKSAMTGGEKEAEIKAGADKVFENDYVVIIKPKTREASCLYGAGTKWCTASGSSYNYFNDYYYKKADTLYYVLTKVDKAREAGIKIPKNWDKIAVQVTPKNYITCWTAEDGAHDYEDCKPFFRKLGITDL